MSRNLMHTNCLHCGEPVACISDSYPARWTHVAPDDLGPHGEIRNYADVWVHCRTTTAATPDHLEREADQ